MRRVGSPAETSTEREIFTKAHGVTSVAAPPACGVQYRIQLDLSSDPPLETALKPLWHSPPREMPDHTRPTSYGHPPCGNIWLPALYKLATTHPRRQPRCVCYTLHGVVHTHVARASTNPVGGIGDKPRARSRCRILGSEKNGQFDCKAVD